MKVTKFLKIPTLLAAFLVHLALLLSGCTTNQELQGGIDLVALLDPASETSEAKSLEDVEPESVIAIENERKRLEKAFINFHVRYENVIDEEKIIARNRIQDIIIAHSNQQCGTYKQTLKKGDYDSYPFSQTILSGAGPIFTPASTTRQLSGIATIISGVRAEFNQEYFYNQVTQVLIKGFETKRARILEVILENREDPNAQEYSIEVAITDAIHYHANCTLVSGLEEVASAIERVNNPGLREIKNMLEILEKHQKDFNRVKEIRESIPK